MKHQSHALRAQNFFTLIGLSSLVFVWFALSLGVSGLFFIPCIGFGFTLMGIFVLFLLIKMLSLLDIPEKVFILLFIAIALVIALPVEPTVFTGRDQGSIATAAIALSKYHSFRFSSPVVQTFFAAYGPGLAYNFPGFFYTEDGSLLTQFPPAYTAWLGSFYALFGLGGLALGNSVLLALSFLSFYFLLRYFLHRFLSFMGTLLFATSFLPTWFAKFTLTENLAIFLFTFLAFSVIHFRNEGKLLHYIAALSAAGMFFFTRIEGIALLPITLVLLAQSRHTRSLWKHYPKKSLVVPIFLFLLTLLVSLPDMIPFYKTIGKALRSFLTSPFSSHPIPSMTSSPYSLLLLLSSYGLSIIFIVGFIGIALLIWKKRYDALIPTIIALPTFLYLFFPNITFDHPWMLRRYLPTLYPTIVFSAMVGITYLFAKKKSFPIDSIESPRRRFILALILSGLFAFQITAWYQGLLIRENPELLYETGKIAALFGPRDLVLLDRDASGSGFAMVSGPLAMIYHKQAVYFFNPEDLGKIDRSAYEHTWLVVPVNKTKQWSESLQNYSLIPKQAFPFGSLSLGTSAAIGRDLSFPEPTSFGSTDIIFEIE